MVRVLPLSPLYTFAAPQTGTALKNSPDSLQFGVQFPLHSQLVNWGERANKVVGVVAGKGVRTLFPGYTQTQPPIFTLNVRETLPPGLALCYLLWVQGQQWAKLARNNPTADPGRAGILAAEAAISHGILSTTRYVYPALGLAGLAYQAGKAPTVRDKLETTLRIVTSMAVFSAASLLGTGYNLAQTKADVKKLSPHLKEDTLAGWKRHVEKLANATAPADLMADELETFKTAQAEVMPQWRQFEEVALKHAPVQHLSLTSRTPSMRLSGAERLKQFDQELKKAHSIAAKYRARHAIVQTMSQLYPPLHNIEQLANYWPENPLPKDLRKFMRHLKTVNQPYVRFSRFLTPIAFGVLASAVVAAPITKIITQLFEWVFPKAWQQQPAYVPDKPGWLGDPLKRLGGVPVQSGLSPGTPVEGMPQTVQQTYNQWMAAPRVGLYSPSAPALSPYDPALTTAAPVPATLRQIYNY